jgi:hypothetical protein
MEVKMVAARKPAAKKPAAKKPTAKKPAAKKKPAARRPAPKRRQQEEYDNTNKGALWWNARKEEGDNRPDFVGSLDVEGVEYWISAWTNDSDNEAAPVYRLAIQPK